MRYDNLQVAQKRGSFKKGYMRTSVFEGGVRLEGVLEKKGTEGGVMSKWQQRHFTCQGHYLRYKDTSKKGAEGEDDQSWTKGCIDLNKLFQLDIKKDKRHTEKSPKTQRVIVLSYDTQHTAADGVTPV